MGDQRSTSRKLVFALLSRSQSGIYFVVRHAERPQANQHAHRAEVGGRKHGQSFAAASRATFEPSGASLVMLPNRFAIAAEEKRRIVSRSPRLDEVTANHHIHTVRSGGAAQPINHPRHGFREDFLGELFVNTVPVEQPESVFREHEDIASSLTRSVHDLLQFGEISAANRGLTPSG